MKKLARFSVGLMMLSAVQISLAQEETRPPGGIPANSPPQWVQKVQDARAKQAEQIEKTNKEQSPPVRQISAAERTEATKRAKAEQAERNKRLEEINRKLSAPAEYYSKFAEFLKAKNTGLARLFPDKSCGDGLTVDVKELERCANMAEIKGAGSLYSFRLNELPGNLPLEMILSFIGRSDMHFVEDKFIVGNRNTQDIISNAGEVELSDITAKSNSVKFLTEFKPSKTTAELKLQNQELKNGVTNNGYFYSTSAQIKLNNTYVLRSIAYVQSDFKSFWNTDQLVAFKVVGQEKDGSVVILWKKLKEKEAPSLKTK
jgi:hypothetical protein